MKAVVLDLDETLGAFTAFSQYVKGVSPYLVTSTLFVQLLDRNPEYLRPGILEVLRFLGDNRRLGRCKLALYTNNQNPVWVKLVVFYLETKVGALFDRVIHCSGAEKKRTGHAKCVADLLACTSWPKQTRFFFIDDQHHPGMVAPTVEYFQIAPYAQPCPAFPQTRELMRRSVAFLQAA